METDDRLTGLVLEMRRGVIVLCVLHELQQPMYGYHLVRQLTEHGIPVEANTLYPLLRRLEGQGLLESEWETAGPKPRKYYVTTDAGCAVCSALKRHWDAIAEGVKTLWEDTKHGT